MEQEDVLKITEVPVSNNIGVIASKEDIATSDSTLQKNKDSILGDTKVAPTGSLFIAAVRVSTTGDGGIVNFPALGHKTGVLYLISDDESDTTPGYAIMKILPPQEGYFFYLYFRSTTNFNSLKIDPSILGTTINGDVSQLDVLSEAPVVFIGTDNGWYTIYN